MIEAEAHSASQHKAGRIIYIQALLYADNWCRVVFGTVAPAGADSVHQQLIR